MKFVSRPLPRFAGNRQVIKILQNLPQTGSTFSTHFGVVASGDEDIVNTARGQELRNLTNCIAVAWEGARGARACKFNQTCYVELRGVTDTADHQAAADFEANLVIAMSNLAQVIIRWRAMLQTSGVLQQVATPEQWS